MKTLAVIPARGGSKGIPRKNIAPLGGRPLIQWTIDAALNARQVDRVVVSTDEEEIAAVARTAGAEVPFLRPADLASDIAPALPVIRHAYEQIASAGWSPDAIIYLQPTSPFRNATHIDRAISRMLETDADTVVSVTRVPHAMTPNSLMQRNGEGWLDFTAPPETRFFRRQDKETFLARNGPAILLLRMEVALSDQLYGDRIAGFEMDDLHSLDIDEPIDLEIAEALIPLATRR